MGAASHQIQSEVARLRQEILINQLAQTFLPTDMVTVYSSDRTELYSYGTFCALIPTSQVQRCLEHANWDLHAGEGLPCAISRFKHGQEVVEYARFGQIEPGIEPLVLLREFHGMRKNYLELSEEFRLFHHLYHDGNINSFWKFTSDGSEELVAEISASSVRIRVREIREFLAVKECHLAIYHDSYVFSTQSLLDLGLTEATVPENQSSVTYNLCLRNWPFSSPSERKSVSHVLAKQMLPPMNKSKVPFLGYSKDVDYPDFVVAVDEDDNEIRSTSNPSKLADYLGGNSDTMHYLTPVQFKKAVLEKYFAQPDKYRVLDSRLSCAGLWSLTIDNHHQDHVIVWLGDLGRDLPQSEWLHWLSHNEPQTIQVSEPFFRRQMLGLFTPSERPEHQFANVYEELTRVSQTTLGWPLLLPLEEKDRHSLTTIRIPPNNDQKTFDELILSLTKVIIDCINEQKIKALLPEDSEKVTGGISRLERVLQVRGARELNGHIQFLRELQDLRSKGSAHRKGSGYEKLSRTMDMQSRPLKDVFRDLLIRAVDWLKYLTESVKRGLFSNEPER